MNNNNINNKNKILPAYLWIGQEQELIKYTKDFLKKLFCSNNCQKCMTCVQIDNQQFHNTLWLKPENTYTVDSLENIFQIIKFNLEHFQHFFFILEQADLLNSASSNSLLKIIEEPPPGYHFILTTSNRQAIAPTIASRCIIQNIGNYNLPETGLIINYFINSKKESLTPAIKEINQIKINEKDIIYFIDQIHTSFSRKLKEYIKNNDISEINIINKKIDIINKSRSTLPMPGSTKIFLRNLLIQLTK